MPKYVLVTTNEKGEVMVILPEKMNRVYFTPQEANEMGKALQAAAGHVYRSLIFQNREKSDDGGKEDEN